MRLYIEQIEQRCAWCHRVEGELIEIEAEIPDLLARRAYPKRLLVHRAHEAPIRAHLIRVLRYARGVGLAAAAAALMIAVAVAVLSSRTTLGVGNFWTGLLIGVPVGFIGLLLLFFPFPWSGTVRLIGLRRSIMAVRLAGVLLAGIGAALLLSATLVAT